MLMIVLNIRLVFDIVAVAVSNAPYDYDDTIFVFIQLVRRVVHIRRHHHDRHSATTKTQSFLAPLA